LAEAAPKPVSAGDYVYTFNDGGTYRSYVVKGNDTAAIKILGKRSMEKIQKVYTDDIGWVKYAIGDKVAYGAGKTGFDIITGAKLPKVGDLVLGDLPHGHKGRAKWGVFKITKMSRGTATLEPQNHNAPAQKIKVMYLFPRKNREGKFTTKWSTGFMARKDIKG
jgi:hypothetical protein